MRRPTAHVCGYSRNGLQAQVLWAGLALGHKGIAGLVTCSRCSGSEGESTESSWFVLGTPGPETEMLCIPRMGRPRRSQVSTKLQKKVPSLSLEAQGRGCRNRRCIYTWFDCLLVWSLYPKDTKSFAHEHREYYLWSISSFLLLW